MEPKLCLYSVSDEVCTKGEYFNMAYNALKA